jgi:hypothetical protein
LPNLPISGDGVAPPGYDRQTALGAGTLCEAYQTLGIEHQRVCFTTHHFGHQGIADEWMLWATGLGESNTTVMRLSMSITRRSNPRCPARSGSGAGILKTSAT